MKKILISLLAVCLTTLSCSYKKKLSAKNIMLPPLYSSGMILQVKPNTQISGFADPGGTLAIRMKDFIRYATADEQGKWNVSFPSVRYTEPFTIQIEGVDTVIRLNNIRAGRLYAIVGNTAFHPIKAETHPIHYQSDSLFNSSIRIFQAENSNSSFLTGQWYPANEMQKLQNLQGAISAIKEASEETNAAIGIINLSRPGAQLQAWLKPEGQHMQNVSRAGYDFYKWSLSRKNNVLLDSVLFLKDSSRIGLKKRVGRIWFNDATWKSLDLSGSLAEMTGTTGMKIIYLRKKLLIPPRFHNSNITIDLGFVNGDAEYYFNEVHMLPHTTSQKTKLVVPDTLITSYSNLLCIRLFIQDSLSGFYADDFICFNEDSGFYEPIGTGWKYNLSFEPDVPDLPFELDSSAELYSELLSPAKEIPFDGIYLHDSFLEESEVLESSLQELLNYFAPAATRTILYTPFSSLDSILYPEQAINREEALKKAAENSGAKLISHPFND